MTDFTFYTDIQQLDAESVTLIHAADAATNQSYAPYSKFNVGASLLLTDGQVITGANQENASYPLCMCAERVALYKLSTTPGVKIKKLVVVARKETHPNLTSATCCGACRQVMVEFEQRQQSTFEVIMLLPDGQWVKAHSAASLLPFSFTGSSLSTFAK